MSNTMISLEDVFLPSVLRIMEKWREVAIITGQNAFQFVPQKENPTYRPGEKYPLLRGRSAPNWVLDDVGNDFVAKDGITRRLSSAAGKSAIKMEIKLAHERIYGHFAWKLGLPFPPTCIWETCKDGKPKYYSISMRAFPDSECDPPKRFLRRTPFLPSIAIQDLWMDHIDGHGANIVYSPSDMTGSKCAFVDRESMCLSLYDSEVPAWLWPLAWNTFSSRTHRDVREQMETSDQAQRVLTQIEHFSDAEIIEPYKILSPQLMNEIDVVSERDFLLSRRDNLRCIINSIHRKPWRLKSNSVSILNR